MDIVSIIVFLVVSIGILIVLSSFLKVALWLFNPIFSLLNHLMNIVYNPFRFMLKNKNSNVPRKLFKIFFYTGLYPIYWLIVHILLTPFRFVNSLYYEVLLYWSIMFDDSIQEVFNPKMEGYRHLKGWKYAFKYVLFFIPRLAAFALKNVLTIIDSILMVGISTVFPTLTYYHGTHFNNALVPIAQNRTWFVGNGDWVGAGIYFGIQRKVAEHYAPGGEDKGIIIARVTMSFSRNGSTLKPALKALIGSDGSTLSERLGFPWSTIEHWRDSMNGWWEYCIVQPGKQGEFVSSWRIRPVALLNHKNLPARLWGGMYHYSRTPGAWVAGIISWIVIFGVLLSIMRQ